MATSATKRTWKLQEFVAHSGNVNCLALGRKSGRVMVTGGEDKKVNIWIVGKPNSLMSLSGHTSAIESVRFGKDENLVVAGSSSGALKVWDLEAAKILRTLTGHKANICSVDFHPYGEFVASGSVDTNIKLWDIKRKGCIFTYKGHTKAINCIRFSPDGRWVASAGEDGVVKMWDLTAGRQLGEFNLHTAGVNCVEFHPNEFLLATGSSDRTVKFWDLETFQIVGSTDCDATPVRGLCFHPEGQCVYSAGQDSVKVYGWEPTQTYDSLAVGWGKVADMAITGHQLIGGTFQQSNVLTYVVDVQRVQPIGGPVYKETQFTHQVPVSGRRSFTNDRPSTHSGPEDRQPPAEEPDEPAAEWQPEDGKDDDAVIQDPDDYKQIFKPTQTLSRSPPKDFPAPPEDISIPPAPISAPQPVKVIPPAVKAPAKQSSSGSTRTPAVRTPIVAPPITTTKDPEPVVRARVAQPAPSAPVLGSVAPAPVTSSFQQKPDIDANDFLPKQPTSMTESDSLTFILKGHTSVSSVMNSRVKNLQIVRAMYNGNNMKAALDSTISTGDKAVLVDIINVMVQRSSLWNLDICSMLIPQLQMLLNSKYESYVTSACSGLKVILKNFASVIKGNLVAPPSVGVDISREERYHKCKSCYEALMHINSQLSDKTTLHSKLGPQIRELQLLMSQLD